VEVDAEADADYAARVPLVVPLHRALRDYPGELPFLGPFTGLPARLTMLAQRPDLLGRDDLDRARRGWAALGPLFSSRERFTAAFPRAFVQPVHGDAPWYNLIRTKTGFLHADFEEVTVGPVELDLALLPDAAAAYDAAAARAGLRALDRDALAAVTAVARLNMVAALAFAPQLPMLVDALAPSIAHWRSTPFASGVVRV
jgi:hypothetical protein